MSSLDFDPNLVPRLNVWATYVPRRTTKPKFATHRTRAHAMSALCFQPEGVLYRWNTLAWVEVFRMEMQKGCVAEGCREGYHHKWARSANGDPIGIVKHCYRHRAEADVAVLALEGKMT